jgi:tripartite-type tricarboxylate transporter receptor subunit TctC
MVAAAATLWLAPAAGQMACPDPPIALIVPFAPAGTPPDIVALLVKESRVAFRRRAAIDEAGRAGFEITAAPPEHLAARRSASANGARTDSQSRHQAGVKCL